MIGIAIGILLWNDGPGGGGDGGGGSPSLNFSISTNSQYLGGVF